MDFDFNYSSVASIVNAAEKSSLPISTLVLKQQAMQLEETEEAIFEQMHRNYTVMAECIEPGSSEQHSSP